jgi:hypothetical protein
MDALFGVVNIPNVVWIDEQGMIVRPAEPGWPSPRHELPAELFASRPKMGRAKTAPAPRAARPGQQAVLTSGQDRSTYPDAIRDWAEHGAASTFVLAPADVVARSQPRSMDESAGAAHFELANHLWRTGARDRAIVHFAECHRLQPHNWTYKRQAWSLVSNERVGGDIGRFVQGPLEGEEDAWPFDSDFRSDVSALGEGMYYPKTL